MYDFTKAYQAYEALHNFEKSADRDELIRLYHTAENEETKRALVINDIEKELLYKLIQEMGEILEEVEKRQGAENEKDND